MSTNHGIEFFPELPVTAVLTAIGTVPLVGNVYIVPDTVTIPPGAKV